MARQLDFLVREVDTVPESAKASLTHAHRLLAKPDVEGARWLAEMDELENMAANPLDAMADSCGADGSTGCGRPATGSGGVGAASDPSEAVQVLATGTAAPGCGGAAGVVEEDQNLVAM